MNKHRLVFLLMMLTLAVCGERVSAHYLWVVSGNTQDQKPVADIYFEESPRAGDGHYLDHFLGSSDVWVRTLEEPSPDPVKASEVKRGENRWMQVPMPDVSEFSVDSYGKFGVYAYGDRKVLLQTKDAGAYTFRSSVEMPTKGEEDGEAYEAIRHNITLSMKFPFEEGP